MSKFISTAELDFEGRLDSLRTYLKSQDRFADYNFDGSNLSVLLDILAQNGYLHGYYLNMAGTEAFLDSAQLRESLVSRSKELNYMPRSKTSARAVVNVTITPSDSPFQITIPKYYAFKVPVAANKTSTFLTAEPTVITVANGIYSVQNLTIYEGVLVNEFFTLDSTLSDGYYTYNSDLVLGSENIDAASIEVQVQLPGDTTWTQYTKALSLFDLNNTSKVFFVQASGANKYQVIFGDGIFGVGLASDTKVKVTYRDTLGADGNGVYSFAKTASIDSYSSIAIQTVESAYGGSERESNESMRFNAPRHFQVQERAVVPSDYEALVRENFPEVQAVSAFGGEVRKQYGRVFIVVKPAGLGNTTVSTSLKQRMKNFLKNKNMTSEPIFIEPDYFYLKINSEVFYDRNLTLTNTATLKSAVISALIDLNNTMFASFGANVRPSKIEAEMDGADESIKGNATTYLFVKRLYPSVNVRQQFTIDFGNAIFSDDVLNAYPVGHETGISSNQFQVLVDDVATDVVLADDGLGKLYLYQVLSDTVNSKIGASVGTVDYDTGVIQVDTTFQGYTTSVDIIARMKSREIDISDDKFVIIDGADLSVTMVSDNG